MEEMTCAAANRLVGASGVLGNPHRSCGRVPDASENMTIEQWMVRWAPTCCGGGGDICSSRPPLTDAEGANAGTPVDSVEMVEQQIVQGSMTMVVDDPEGFAEDIFVRRALRASIAEMCGAPVTADDVAVSIEVVSRRLTGGQRRRLDRGSVRVDYTIVVEEAASAQSLSAQLAELEPAAWRAMVNEQLVANSIGAEVAGVSATEAPTARTQMVPAPRAEERDSQARAPERRRGSLGIAALSVAVATLRT